MLNLSWEDYGKVAIGVYAGHRATGYLLSGALNTGLIKPTAFANPTVATIFSYMNTIVDVLGTAIVLWSIQDFHRTKNHAHSKAHEHTFFAIENTSNYSAVHNQTKIGIKAYDSVEKYAQELEKTAA